MPSVLIAGGAGFVGSHLTDRYLRDGWDVLAIDNLSTGSHHNLAEARTHRGFEFLERDVTELTGELRRCDLILHFASPASPADYARHPIETMRANSVGTERCIALALEWDARLLFASTSEVYGDPHEHPQTESYWGNVNPIGARAAYDESKRFGEALIAASARARGLDARIVRIFNTYGPRMRVEDGRVVPNFISQALRGSPLTVYGDGRQTRSFCYVDDLVEGIVRCASCTAAAGRPVNLGNPEEHSIADFARIVGSTAGVSVTTQAMPLPPDDPMRRRPDISLARALLDWSPRVSLELGLKATIDSMRTVPTGSGT
ncbi:MAG TPA: NAD-dependent epimerase/dehydratase family protein [Candidatus Acidoferrales bacterium]|jgi:dTDP-glucose 4,6-dehydratase|nr:NAD-dependent epimerase/dehydratase family protein [Candidatus Acidoferrales bacterium]